MKLEIFILGLLKINPYTGYDIKKYLDTEGRFGRARAPLSQIYTTLKRMTADGWVFFEEVHRDNKPDIKLYHNTEVGDQVFMDYLHSPVDQPFRFRESDILYRGMFSFLVDLAVVLEQLQTELDFRRAQIAKFCHRDLTLQADNLTEDQRQRAQKTYDELHRCGARAIDDYVQSLEELIASMKKPA